MCNLILLSSKADLVGLLRGANSYWLAMLLLSTVMMSLAAVLIPAAFHQRYHNGLLALNEFLASIQLGLLTYYFAMLVETDFGNDKSVPVVIYALVLATFVFIVIGSKQASPAIQEQLLNADHQHSSKYPPPPCTRPVTTRTRWRLCWLNFALFLISFPIAIFVPRLLPAATPPTLPQQPDYTGEWDGHIDWSPDWAGRLFDYKGDVNQLFCGCPVAPRFVSANPHSDGNVVIYRMQTGYKMLSTWTLINGETTYSDVAVVGDTFQFDSAGKVTRFDMRTMFRAPRIKYRYAPYYHYYFKITDASETRLKGQMIAIDDKDKGKEATAGAVNLDLRSKPYGHP
jgi:hypothetical protein